VRAEHGGLYHDRVMPRAKKSSTTWPFPFFGAGEASYFEWAEVHVLFTREPSKTEKRKIKQNVPLALQDSFDWEGPALMVASDQFAHVAIAEQFARDDDEDEDDDDDDDDEDDEGRWFFASSAAVTRFNEATEAWLREAHEVCPILLAFRREDGESGGTELSDWHDWSVRSLPELLPALRELMQTNSDSHRAYLLRGVLEMGHDAKITLPDDLLDWLDPARVLAPILATGSAEQLIERLTATGSRGIEALENCYDSKQAAHRRALLGASSWLVQADAFEDELLDAALCEPQHASSPAILERVRLGLADGSRDADSLAYRAYGYIQDKRWTDAIALFEMVLDRPGLALTGHNNALYAVMHDNNGLPIDRDRHLRFIAAALPHGPANASIFYNAACLYMELGETDRVFDNLALALEHGFDRFDVIREEAMLAPLRGDARFIALLDSMPSKKKVAKKKVAKKKAAKKKAVKKKVAKKKAAKKKAAKKKR
jgi:hypothetical protein